MELSTLVDYEKLYELDIKHPVTDAPLGIKLWIRSIDSSAAERVLFEHADKNMERFIKRRELAKTEQNKRAEIERTAACVVRWEWGEYEFEGQKPELSMSTAVSVFEKIPWMERQAREAAEKVANFTQASAPISASASES